jgi:hypothetical protein
MSTPQPGNQTLEYRLEIKTGGEEWTCQHIGVKFSVGHERTRAALEL